MSKNERLESLDNWIFQRLGNKQRRKEILSTVGEEAREYYKDLIECKKHSYKHPKRVLIFKY